MKETAYLDENLRVINLLKDLDRFKLFEEQDIKNFLTLAKLREYEEGEVIIEEGNFDCWIYFLLKGSLAISKSGKIVGHLRRSGELFGEMGVIDGSPRSATIKAAERSLLLGVDGSVIERKLQEDNLRFCYIIYRIFAEVLATRLRDTTMEAIELKKEIAALKDTN